MKMKSLSAVSALLLLAACATNPVTGQREFNIVSEAQEQQMGDEAARQVLQEFQVYNEKPELNRLVNEIGQRIAAVSDRPNLPWTFTLLDTPMVNAMALPGGHVYVTRGILERMNSTDELAGVIAHEITHVAARHAAQQISQQQLAGIGLAVGSILAGPAATQAYGSLAQLGAQLLFLRYSRQQESHADVIGTAYMAEAGYNPIGAERMLLSLQRLGSAEGSSIDRYFIDHPDPARRVQDVKKEIAALETKSPALTAAPMTRSGFVQQLARIITGPSTTETVIVGNTIYQRRYGIVLPVPAGWQASADPGAVFVLAPGKQQNRGLIVQEIPGSALTQYPNLQSAVRSKLQAMGLQYVTSGSASARTGQRFGIDLWSAQTQSGTIAVESMTIPEGDHGLVFLQISPGISRNESPLASILSTMSFDAARARSAEPPRMKIETSRAGDTWTDVARRATGNAQDAEVVAEINGFDVREPVPAGIALKLPGDVVREE